MKTNINIQIANLKREHCQEIIKIQAEAYITELIEQEEAFLYKLKLYPKGCVGAFHQHSLCGYVLCQPHIEGKIIHLDTDKHEIPSNPTCLYLHDLAIGTLWKGKGIGTLLFSVIEAHAKKEEFKSMALVSVQDSWHFWEKLGFKTLFQFNYIPNVPARYMIYYINE